MTTHPYPAFPTDMQAQYMALMTQGDGSAVITETIFENRFMHALEMIRMGADITIDGRQALVKGGKPLTGAKVLASDLRQAPLLYLPVWLPRGKPGSIESTISIGATVASRINWLVSGPTLNV